VEGGVRGLLRPPAESADRQGRLNRSDIPMLETSGNSQRLNAADVLRRYKDEELPEFCEIPLHDVNQAGNFGDRPIHVASIRGSLDEIAALVHGGADVDATGERATRRYTTHLLKVMSL
jgi:hypothetical protein